MTKEVAEKIVRGITDKIECNTVDIDDWAEFWGFTREEYEEFLDVSIKALEQTRWIPVRERLPKENGFYLATCDGEICGENEPFTGLAEYENGKWVDDEEDYQCVLAWMPLPSSYQGE